MWIAKDKEGWTSLFAHKPHLSQGDDKWFDDSLLWEGYDDWFPEVTFENSPKELVIKD